MKSFIKFLVTLIVVALVGYVVYYVCVINKNTQNPIENKSGENITNVNPIISGKSGEITKSGEVVTQPELSGEELLNKQKEDIKIKIDEIESGEIIKQMDADLELSIAGKDGENLKEYFNVEKLFANVIVKRGKIEVIPYIDFLNNQIFYYDNSGKLIFYENVSNSVGGSSKYYFANEVLIDIEHNYDEPTLVVEDEKADEILSRAKSLYTTFEEAR